MVRRIIVAMSVGLLATALCFWNLWSNDFQAGDFTWAIRGAELVLAGQNPYAVALAPLPYPDADPNLWYPLPAVLVAIPFSFVPAPLAGALFFGIGSGLLAFAITKDSWWRLTLFLSAPYFLASTVAQWSPLLMAASHLPILSMLLVAKPNVGLPLFMAWPTKRAIVLGSLMLGVSLAILPSWPLDWLNNLGSTTHRAPITAIGGVLLLLAALRWRTPEGRLMLGLAFLPQLRAGYDALPLWFIPQTVRASLMLCVASWVGMFSILYLDSTWGALTDSWLVIWNYGPALLILLQPLWKSTQQRKAHQSGSVNSV